LRELNRTEQRAFKELFSMCEDFLTAAEALEDECERDGQPDEAQEWADFDPEC